MVPSKHDEAYAEGKRASAQRPKWERQRFLEVRRSSRGLKVWALLGTSCRGHLP